MPLIILTGLPCVGKTTFANELSSYLSTHCSSKIILINEESLGISKSQGYSSETNEKKTRGALRSAVDHALTPETYVILDSLNYIKGYRYEIYCISRTQRTPHCVVQIHTDDTTAGQWNHQRTPEDAYSEEILVELRRRYEAPIAKNRWDTPLFHVYSSQPPCTATSSADATTAPLPSPLLPCDPSSLPAPPAPPKKSAWKKKDTLPAAPSDESTSDNNILRPPETTALSFSGSFLNTTTVSNALTPTLVMQQILGEASPLPQMMKHSLETVVEYFQSAVAPKPNSSTVPIVHASADLLYELDSISQDIVQAAHTHIRDAPVGTPLMLRDYHRTLEIHRPVSLAELQRHRRMFVKVNSQHPPTSAAAIGSSFVDFLATQL